MSTTTDHESTIATPLEATRRENLRHLSAFLASHQGWEWDSVKVGYNDGFVCEYEYLDGFYIVGRVSFESDVDLLDGSGGGGLWTVAIPFYQANQCDRWEIVKEVTA